MISVPQAEKIILDAAKILPVETCALKEACGRVLREEVVSDRDQPAFDKVLMDGIAIAYAVWQKGRRDFIIERVIAAGDSPYKLKNANHCVQVMTGAVVPRGCDCVVPIEQIVREGDWAKLKPWTLVNVGENIRRQGQDHKKKAVLLKSARQLSPVEIGIAASVGKAKLKVSRKPSVAIVATGDELVDIDGPIQSYQTRLSNSYVLQSLLASSRLVHTDMFHIPDDKKILLENIRRLLLRYDAIVFSGGVSMGEYDYVPQVLNTLRVKQMFHKVTQRPGKPFWFGVAKFGKPVFALPGNPVSTLVCACRYVIPYLKKAAGLDVQPQQVVFRGSVDGDTDLTHFLPVILDRKNGVLQVRPVAFGGSGDFAGLACADGFIQYEHNSQQSVWPYFSWRA